MSSTPPLRDLCDVVDARFEWRAVAECRVAAGTTCDGVVGVGGRGHVGGGPARGGGGLSVGARQCALGRAASDDDPTEMTGDMDRRLGGALDVVLALLATSCCCWRWRCLRWYSPAESALMNDGVGDVDGPASRTDRVDSAMDSGRGAAMNDDGRDGPADEVAGAGRRSTASAASSSSSMTTDDDADQRDDGRRDERA